MSRIVFFVSSMESGGAERVAALLCNHWAGRGHDVMLVPTYSGRGDCFYPLDARVRLEYLADRVESRRRTPMLLLRRLWEMRTIVKTFRPDGVLSFLPHVNIAAILATRGLGVPVVVAERTYPPSLPIGKTWSRLRLVSYPHASHVVLQTKRGLAWLEEASPSSRGSVIPNPCVFPLPGTGSGLDPGAVAPTGRCLLLAVGRLGEEKGFDLLIRAFGSLAGRFPAWDLAILGEGVERVALEALRAREGLDARVHLPGRVGNLGSWYSRADIFVMSSRFEGFPNALMEAMAHGVPAVSFDCATGPADLIEDGVNGILVSPRRGATALADALARLMDDAGLRRSIGGQATGVRLRYAPERVMTEWDRVMGLE